MTEITSDPLFDRLLQSLKDNSAEFEKDRIRKKNRRLYKGIVAGLTFVSGIVVGTLLTSRIFN